ncbi:MAG: SBBP repeat-containing protein, partial [Candidatus Helarchaeota archaeon]
MIRKVKNRYRLLEISIILIIIPAMILIAFIMVSENNFLTTNYSTMNSSWTSGFQETSEGLIINKASSSTGYQLQWNFTIIGNGSGVDEGRKLVVDDNGYLYVGGMIDQGASSVNLFLIKFDQNGNLLWNRSLSSSGTYWDKG